MSDSAASDGYVVTACGELLGGWIASHLQSATPGATIEVRESLEMDAMAIVTHKSTGRWLYLSARVTPDASFARALEHGAASVLSIRATKVEFDMAIRAVRRENGVYVPPDVASWLVAQTSHMKAKAKTHQVKVRLTPRENEVLRLLLEGLTNREIATALTISPNTVRSHLHSLSVKMEASNRARLIHRARELGLDASKQEGSLQFVRDASA